MNTFQESTVSLLVMFPTEAVVQGWTYETRI